MGKENGLMKKHKRCKRCGKRWCGTNLQIIKVRGEDYPGEWVGFRSYGSKKCRDKAGKKKASAD